MSGIRVTYSGLISFIVGIASLFTGLIFTLIVTRKLTQDEFGTWGLIGGLVAYVFIISPIVSYWTTREISRGINSGKTALITNSVFSGVGVLVYIIIIFLAGTQFDVDQNILFFATMLIPVEFIRTVLAGITLGYKPQNVQYGVIVYELAKIPLAFILIFFLEMGLSGAILAQTISSLISIFVVGFLAREKLRGKFERKYIKKWLKLFWIPTYPQISTILTTTDVVIFTIIVGGVGGLAYWGAAWTISLIVTHAAKINDTIYPKLLSGGKKEYLQENLPRVFYFALPLLALSLTFAKPALFALNPLYDVAIHVVIFLVPFMFMRILSNIFTQALSGIEGVDVNENATFMDYLKSKLFYLPTVEIIQRAVYLASLTIVLLVLFSPDKNELDLVVYWSIIALVTQIPYTLYLYVLVSRGFAPKIDFKAILKYLSVSIIIFGFTFLLMEQFLEYKTSIFEFIPNFLQFVILSVLGYLGLTYAIDLKTRTLFKAIINEIKNKSK